MVHDYDRNLTVPKECWTSETQRQINELVPPLKMSVVLTTVNLRNNRTI